MTQPESHDHGGGLPCPRCAPLALIGVPPSAELVSAALELYALSFDGDAWRQVVEHRVEEAPHPVLQRFLDACHDVDHHSHPDTPGVIVWNSDSARDAAG